MAETKTVQTNEETAKGSSFLSYKGYPLVRNKDEIYYGNMNDEYVI